MFNFLKSKEAEVASLYHKAEESVMSAIERVENLSFSAKDLEQDVSELEERVVSVKNRLLKSLERSEAVHKALDEIQHMEHLLDSSLKSAAPGVEQGTDQEGSPTTAQQESSSPASNS